MQLLLGLSYPGTAPCPRELKPLTDFGRGETKFQGYPKEGTKEDATRNIPRWMAEEEEEEEEAGRCDGLDRTSSSGEALVLIRAAKQARAR
ncbi:hypothetical protein PAAG_11144 [Paracoccidioides lutzii Pb01]|uniref:Uncharacterized protein n=1 Tax=Paracoccidioides lutzii (strain ATCC MYA-826 / Pb01) TaxID=502779 RepID=A0A0A2V6I8_PARBA|nr:hypothetical protein PAAG_11144 [Paracoccidioides lutzii Pb01]KGQ01972.1 hypothetical protein PAAG_11144 [Paracoccidioides lutzii Pb01]